MRKLILNKKNKRGTEWTVGKLLTLILAVVFIVLIVWGVSSKAFLPLKERLSGMWDNAKGLYSGIFGGGDDGGDGGGDSSAVENYAAQGGTVRILTISIVPSGENAYDFYNTKIQTRPSYLDPSENRSLVILDKIINQEILTDSYKTITISCEDLSKKEGVQKYSLELIPKDLTSVEQKQEIKNLVINKMSENCNDVPKEELFRMREIYFLADSNKEGEPKKITEALVGDSISVVINNHNCASIKVYGAAGRDVSLGQSTKEEYAVISLGELVKVEESTLIEGSKDFSFEIVCFSVEGKEVLSFTKTIKIINENFVEPLVETPEEDTLVNKLWTFDSTIAQVESMSGKYSAKPENKKFVDSLFDYGLITSKQYNEINGGSTWDFNWEENMDYVKQVLKNNKMQKIISGKEVIPEPDYKVVLNNNIKSSETLKLKQGYKIILNYFNVNRDIEIVSLEKNKVSVKIQISSITSNTFYLAPSSYKNLEVDSSHEGDDVKILVGAISGFDYDNSLMIEIKLESLQ